MIMNQKTTKDMKLTEETKKIVLDMYLRDYEYKDIMQKTKVTKAQIYGVINRFVASSMKVKEDVKQQRIEKAYVMEKEIFDKIERGESIRGYDSIFASFCA